MASKREWENFLGSPQQTDINKYRNIYLENKNDIGGYISQTKQSPTLEFNEERQRWTDFFSEPYDVTNAKKLQQTRAMLPPELKALNPTAGSQWLQEPVESAPEKNLQKFASSRVGYRKGITQADLNRQRREEIQPRNQVEAVLKSIADPVANVIDDLMYDTPSGAFATRAGHSAASMVGPAVGLKPETGNKIADIAADVTGVLTGFGVNAASGGAPGTNLFNGPYRVADAALLTSGGQKLTQVAANQLGKVFKPDTAQRVAEAGLRGAAAGSIQNVAQSGMRGETDADELALSAALGAGFGAVGDVAAYGIGKGIQALMKRNGIPEKEITEILALPPSSKEMRMNTAATRSHVPAGKEPIASPYTLKLPEASPSTKAKAENVSGGRTELQRVDNAISELTTKYEQQVIDEYKYLKESMNSRGGVQQGALYRNATGEVVGRSGRSSNNPLWYQEFYRQYGRKPTNKDLYALARERVDNGFLDETGKVPSWRQQTGYDEQLEGYAAVRSQLEQSLKEMDPALRITDEPIVSEVIRDMREPRTSSANDDIPEFLRLNKETAPLEFPKLDDTPVPKHSLQKQLNASLEELSDPMGISAFGKSKTPYERASLEDTMSQIRSRSQKDFSMESLKEKGHRIYQDFVDDVHAFNRFDKYVESVLGRNLKASEKVHTSALNARGADMIASQIVKNGLVNKNGQVVGKSLKDRLAGLPLNRYAEFEDYLLNRHAITRFERGENVYDKRVKWTPEKGEINIAQYESKYPQFQQIAEQLYDYQRTMVNEWLVKTGMISQEQANAWFEANPFYVPNKRHFTDMEKGGKGFGSKKGYANQSVPVKKFNKKGSQRKVISPIESIIENTDAFVKAAKRNEVMQKFVTNLRQSDDLSDWAEIVQGYNDTRNVKSLLDDGLEHALNEVAKDYDKAFARTTLDTDDVVRVLVNGEPVHIQIKDKDLMKAALALGPERSGWLLDQVGRLTNMFKTFTTGVNPYFVVRNITRDLGDAWINSKSTDNPLNFITDFLKASMDIMKGSNGKVWQEFKNIGGGHTSQVASRNMLGRSKQAVLPQNPIQKMKGLPRTVWRVFEDLLSATESMGRLAEFKRLQGNKTPDELAKALYESQEVSINFKRRGALTKEIDKVFPYFNAAVQGLDRFVRAFKDNPAKASAKAALAMTIPTAVLYAMNRDNPRYQELPENTKDNFFLIPIGDGEKFIRIAKPRELGTIFSSLPERLMRQFADDNPEAWDEFAEQLIKTFTLPGIEGAISAKGGAPQKALGMLRDTIGGPFVDVAMNQNFAGAPIVPGYLERLSPDLQVDEKTSTPARKLAKVLGGSPKQIDYLGQQYLGGLGKVVASAFTPSGKPIGALGDQFVADSVYSNKVSNKFYDIKEKLDQAYADRNVRGELPEWYHDGVRKRFNQLSEGMSETRKRMRAIESDKNLSRDEKEVQLRELREQVNQLARNGIDLTKQLNMRVPD
ncbi:LPD38 domain-containing protein [Paenibacillus apiarius]|uniref:LPD38 domain-containing protein n=1 Tax=Paenibacillus apiarius TaxID=46240 RepID=UPI003B3B7953